MSQPSARQERVEKLAPQLRFVVLAGSDSFSRFRSKRAGKSEDGGRDVLIATLLAYQTGRGG